MLVIKKVSEDLIALARNLGLCLNVDWMSKENKVKIWFIFPFDFQIKVSWSLAFKQSSTFMGKILIREDDILPYHECLKSCPIDIKYLLKGVWKLCQCVDLFIE